MQEKDAKLQEKDAKLQEKNAELRETLQKMVLEVVERIGTPTEEIIDNISKVQDVNALMLMHKIAIEAKSMEQFQEQISKS